MIACRSLSIIPMNMSLEGINKPNALQLQDSFYQSIVPGYEAWGYGASANTAFIVRADALQAVNWFPTYSTDMGLALGIELKIARFLSKFHKEALVQGMSVFSKLY